MNAQAEHKQVLEHYNAVLVSSFITGLPEHDIEHIYETRSTEYSTRKAELEVKLHLLQYILHIRINILINISMNKS